MSPHEDEPRVTLSLFEKLTDEKPGLTEPTPSLRSATVAELRESVVRHLEVLLNTRRSDADIDPAFEESNKSVLTYGVADFTSLLLANTFDREGLRRSMERSIRLFEPRLTHVELTMEEWKPAQFGLHFRISALLRVEPENEPVLFDAVLAKDTRRFQVTGGRAQMEDLYPYYERELLFIRQMASDFAERYPTTAGRLQLSKDRAGDPHVERLIEAFALLAGRVQHKIDDEFPEITESLLGLLYPHYLRPIPSLAIAQFQPDPSVTAPTGATFIESGTALHSRPAAGNICSFKTCYPVRLWPLRVTRATLGTPGSVGRSFPGDVSAVLRLELETLGGLPLSKLPVGSLRFYLNGPGSAVHTLYELLFLNSRQIVLRARPTTPPAPPAAEEVLPAESIRPVGLETAEGVLPYADSSFLGYRLLQEYFHFPQKFLFFDLEGLQRIARPAFGNAFEILIGLSSADRPDRLARLEQSLSGDMFQLGCTPIVNLFDRVAEPIRLSHASTEYRVIADQHRQWTTEVYSVNRVTSTVTYQDEPQIYEPFYSIRHSTSDDPSRRFWYAHRRPSGRKGDAGTEIYLTLVDLNFQPSLPPVEMLTVHLTCTNRDLPGRLQWAGEWGEVSAEGLGPIRVRCIEKPCPTLRAPNRRGLQWRLISHLSLNHLSIIDGGLPALQEILRLYDFSRSEEEGAEIRKQITGIVDLSSRPSTSLVRSDTGVAFCRGTDVTLRFDEQQFAGTGVFLLASVLERFFGLYASINSYSRLTARTSQGVLKQWPPLAGEQRIL